MSCVNTHHGVLRAKCFLQISILLSQREGHGTAADENARRSLANSLTQRAEDYSGRQWIKYNRTTSRRVNQDESARMN